MLRESRAAWGTAILMKVDDGDIKAISNLERDSAGNYIEAMNYAMMRMEPGSVTKAISMVIALEDGFITDPNAMYETPAGGYFYGSTQKGTEIKDTHSPASLPVCQFLRYSSNIGVTKLVAPHFDKILRIPYGSLPSGRRPEHDKTGCIPSQQRTDVWTEVEIGRAHV